MSDFGGRFLVSVKVQEGKGIGEMFNCHVVFNKRRRKETENNNKKKNKQTSAAVVAPSETGTQKNCLSWGTRADLCIPC